MCGRDTVAVVGDPDEFDAALFEFDGDAGRPCVDGVVDEFLDDGGGAFDDLARRDLVGDQRREDADFRDGGGRGAHRRGVYSAWLFGNRHPPES